MGVDGSAGVSVMGPIMPAPPVDAETPTRRASPGAGGTPVTLTPVRAETEIPETIPENFRLAVRSMHEAPVRSGITVTEIRPPRKLAPLSHAVGLEVDRGLSEDELLAAAEQVEVCVRGDRLAGFDHQQFGVQATPLETFLAHHGIAVIAVDAQQRLVQQDDPGVVEAHMCSPIRRSFWNGV